MKKKNIYVILSLGIASFVLFGCASKNTSDEEMIALKTQVAELEQLIQATHEVNQSSSNVVLPEVPPVENTPIPIPTPTQNLIEEVVLGQTVAVPDITEFTLRKVYFAKKILPPTPDGYYTYYEAKEIGTTYLDIVIVYKNLQTTGIEADRFGSVRVIYDEKYDYMSFSIIEDNGGSDFTYTSITDINPLQMGTIHYLAEVPDEVEVSGLPIHIIITVNGGEYKYRLR